MVLFMRNGIYYTGVAVVTEFANLWSASLPSNISAQGAELIGDSLRGNFTGDCSLDCDWTILLGE